MFGMRMTAGALLAVAAAGIAWAQIAQPNDNGPSLGTLGEEKPAYLNPNLPSEQRAADLVRRMTLEEKASQLVNQARAIPRLGVPAYDWWSEALHGVAVEWDDGVSRADWPGGDLRYGDDPRDGRGHQHRGAREAPARAGGARWKQRNLRGAGLLGAKHQHLPRSALGTGPGDLRRGSVPDGADGRGVRDRDAGRRSALLPRDLDAKALRRALRAGADAALCRCGREQARRAGHVSAGVPSGGDRGQGGQRDVRVQQHQRAAGLRE